MKEVQIKNEKKVSAIITAIATGRSHVLALDIQGNVYSWGRNVNGQLGLGRYKEREVSKKKKKKMIDFDEEDAEELEFVVKPTQILGKENNLKQ